MALHDSSTDGTDDGLFAQLTSDLAELRERIIVLERFRVTYQQDRWKVERLACVLADTNDAVSLIDLDGKILEWNAGAERLYGYTESEALAMNVDEIVPVLKQKDERQQRIALKLRGTMAPYESQRLTKSGQVVDVLLVQSLVGPDMDWINSTDRDIGHRRQIRGLEVEINALCKRIGEDPRYRSDGKETAR